ncbi:hypothetical protein N7456_008708 [Penicillium angulare]|uniref:F-box domain-containing protein n=1 Tax=Penicillium angulare TaxID=116970 RepID=A0A9W9F3F1_9EURO|nr:hypothetical protein N7456_008708 [Penicillium angulare]
MSLQSLPAELLIWIMSSLDLMKDCNSLVQTSHRCHAILNDELYIQAVSKLDFSPLFWAASMGHTRSLQHFFEIATPGLARASGNFDIRWISRYESLIGLCINYHDKDMFDLVPTFPWPPEGGDDTKNRFISTPECLGSHRPIVCLYQDALIEAIMNDHLEAVKSLLDKIPWSPNQISTYLEEEEWPYIEYPYLGFSLSHIAARYDVPAIVDFFVANGIDLAPDKKSRETSPLHIASVAGNLDVLNTLIQHGLDIDMVDDEGKTPLFNAMVHGHVDIAKALLNHGADLFKKFQGEFTPLFIATFAGQACMLKFLLDAGLNHDGSDADGNVPQLIEAATVDNLNLDLSAGFGYAQEWIGVFDCSSPLGITAFLDHSKVALLFLEYGANPNIMDLNGKLPLYMAIEQRSLKTAAVMIEKGARLDMVDGLGSNLFYYALLPNDDDLDNSECVRLIIDSCGPELKQDWIFSVLQHEHSAPGVSLPTNRITHREDIVGPASRPSIYQMHDSDRRYDSVYRQLYEPGYESQGSRCSCEKMLAIFLDRGISVDVRDSLGRTLLHQAAYWMCMEASMLLISRGANPLAQDSFGQTPLHLAVVHTPEEPHLLWKEIALLFNGGGVSNCKDSNGQTPLHIAAQAGNYWAVHRMISPNFTESLAEVNQLDESWESDASGESTKSDELTGYTEPAEDEVDQSGDGDELDGSDQPDEPGEPGEPDDNDDFIDVQPFVEYSIRFSRADWTVHKNMQRNVTVLDNSGSTPYHLAAAPLSSRVPIRFIMVLRQLKRAGGSCTCTAIDDKDSNCARLRRLIRDLPK